MTSVRWAFNSSKWQPTKVEWMRLAQYIQPEEKARIGKFIFKRDAKASMIGRILMRKLIHRLTKIPYGDIRLGRTDKGKPYLLNDLPGQTLSFNVSHQGKYVVLAAEADCEVGIDVMNSETPRGRSLSEFFHIMRNQFTQAEWSCIRSHSTESDQLMTFYRLWCLKESYVKALGIGIGFEVKRLNFNLLTPRLVDQTHPICTTRLELDGRALTDWTFEEAMIDGHCVAVACHRAPKSDTNNAAVPFTFLDTVELLQDCTALLQPDEKYADMFMSREEDQFS